MCVCVCNVCVCVCVCNVCVCAMLVCGCGEHLTETQQGGQSCG